MFDVEDFMKAAFFGGVEWQMFNEAGTDTESWEEGFEDWMSETHIYGRDDDG